MARTLRSEHGFTLPELLVATGLLLVVSSIVTNALVQMTNQQQTIWNRTEMHSGVRGATELLQQEVGQAGRIALPTADGTVTLTAAVAGVSPCAVPVTATVTSTAGMFVGEWLTTLDGDNGETVAITAIPSATQVTACFTQNHAANTTKLTALGGFATGIMSNLDLNGSTANKLKLYGDVNGDGNMVYIEYYCDNGDPGTDGSFNLYRNVMSYTTLPAAKPALNNSMILLGNVHPNPVDAGGVARPCFSYQAAPTPVVVNGITYNFVLDVAVTLTVWTQSLDPVTKTYQTETKALLNVSPRNVFFTWEFAGLNYNTRVQPTPPTVTALLP
jgi:prepilin-type N-terminal cleavage/methylation domain-containing protein